MPVESGIPFTRPPLRQRGHLSRTALLVSMLGVLSAACGAGSERQVRELARQELLQSEARTSLPVREHLEEILTLAETHSIRRSRIDWRAFKEEVWSAARGAHTLLEAEPAILRALQLLDDGHSFYQPAAHGQNLPGLGLPAEGKSGTGSAPRPRIFAFVACAQVPAPTPAIPPGIGYVRVPGSARLPELDAEQILHQVSRTDRQGLYGWIVDLRGNSGGNMWPMLLGIGPLLGEGIAGYFVEPDGTRREWGYVESAAVLAGKPQIASAAPYTLHHPARRIAVLIDEATVSSGEALVVAFRGRAGTRIFGQPTCGRSSVNRTFRLRNGAMLALTVGQLADREGKIYEGRIEPDEEVEGSVAVQRAIEWLTSPVAR